MEECFHPQKIYNAFKSTINDELSPDDVDNNDSISSNLLNQQNNEQWVWSGQISLKVKEISVCCHHDIIQRCRNDIY